MIPKKIFQTHEYRYEDLPEHYKQTSLSWQNLNPGWEYVYHDKDQRSKYIIENKPELYELYKSVKGAHKADIWRYLIVSLEGGVYADMDSFCITPMDYILEGLSDHIDLVSTKTEAKEHTNNANFAGVKGSKILKQCLEDIAEAQFVGQNMPNQFIIHQCFSDNVNKNPDTVSKTMQASHSSSYKKSFDLSMPKIDYYGEKMSYADFLSSKNML
jgi:mannosyltransferase OCH1-like enzyme